MTLFTPQAIDGLPTFWKDCATTQDVTLLDELLRDHADAPVGAIALALCSTWMITQLTARGIGPETWPAEAWWTLVGLGSKPYSNQTAVARHEFYSRWAHQENYLWKATQKAAVAKFSASDWAVLIGAAMEHPNPYVMKTWADRAVAHGQDLNALMVPPGPSLLGLVRNTGCLARVAWVGNHRWALETLVHAGLRLDLPEPAGDPAWAAPGWTLDLQIDAELKQSPWLQRKAQEWQSLLNLSRERALDAALPAVDSVRLRSGPRF